MLFCSFTFDYIVVHCYCEVTMVTFVAWSGWWRYLLDCAVTASYGSAGYSVAAVAYSPSIVSVRGDPAILPSLLAISAHSILIHFVITLLFGHCDGCYSLTWLLSGFGVLFFHWLFWLPLFNSDVIWLLTVMHCCGCASVDSWVLLFCSLGDTLLFYGTWCSSVVPSFRWSSITCSPAFVVVVVMVRVRACCCLTHCCCYDLVLMIPLFDFVVRYLMFIVVVTVVVRCCRWLYRCTLRSGDLFVLPLPLLRCSWYLVRCRYMRFVTFMLRLRFGAIVRSVWAAFVRYLPRSPLLLIRCYCVDLPVDTPFVLVDCSFRSLFLPVAFVCVHVCVVFLRLPSGCRCCCCCWCPLTVTILFWCYSGALWRSVGIRLFSAVCCCSFIRYVTFAPHADSCSTLLRLQFVPIPLFLFCGTLLLRLLFDCSVPLFLHLRCSLLMLLIWWSDSVLF